MNNLDKPMAFKQPVESMKSDEISMFTRNLSKLSPNQMIQNDPNTSKYIFFAGHKRIWTSESKMTLFNICWFDTKDDEST